MCCSRQLRCPLQLRHASRVSRAEGVTARHQRLRNLASSRHRLVRALVSTRTTVQLQTHAFCFNRGAEEATSSF